MKAETGDKVRLKAKGHPGARGIVEAIKGDRLVVGLEDSDQRVLVAPEEVTRSLSEEHRAKIAELAGRVGALNAGRRSYGKIQAAWETATAPARRKHRRAWEVRPVPHRRQSLASRSTTSYSSTLFESRGGIRSRSSASASKPTIP